MPYRTAEQITETEMVKILKFKTVQTFIKKKFKEFHMIAQISENILTLSHLVYCGTLECPVSLVTACARWTAVYQDFHWPTKRNYQSVSFVSILFPGTLQKAQRMTEKKVVS